MDQTMRECIDNCNNCKQVCQETLEYCREIQSNYQPVQP